MSTNATTTRPAHEVCLGSVKAAIWKHGTDSGDPTYSVTFARLYRKDDKWNYSDGFRRDDLLVLAKVADLAHSWIFADRASGQEEAPEA